MSKINVNKKALATAMALGMLVLPGCKGEKKEIKIMPDTKLSRFYDELDSYTSMDEYVDSVNGDSGFDLTDLSNIENEDMAEVNRRIYTTALSQLKGMILDALNFPAILINDVSFNAPTYTLTISYGNNNQVSTVSVSSKNITDLVRIITAAQSGTIRMTNAEEAYDIVKSATLLTGTFDNKTKKVNFEYDDEKINAAKSSKLIG